MKLAMKIDDVVSALADIIRPKGSPIPHSDPEEFGDQKVLVVPWKAYFRDLFFEDNFLEFTLRYIPGALLVISAKTCSGRALDFGDQNDLIEYFKPFLDKMRLGESSNVLTVNNKGWYCTHFRWFDERKSNLIEALDSVSKSYYSPTL